MPNIFLVLKKSNDKIHTHYSSAKKRDLWIPNHTPTHQVFSQSFIISIVITNTTV